MEVSSDEGRENEAESPCEDKECNRPKHHKRNPTTDYFLKKEIYSLLYNFFMT